LNNCI